MGIKNFFKKAFRDMKEDTKAQHEVTKANFAAAKADARVATHVEGKTIIKEISIPNKIINIVVK